MKKLGVLAFAVLGAAGAALAHDAGADSTCHNVTTDVGVVCMVGTPDLAEIDRLAKIHEAEIARWAGR